MAEAEQLLEYIEQGFGHLSRPRILAAPNRNYTINIAVADASPVAGLTSYATLGVSSYELTGRQGVVPFRIELLASCNDQFDFAPVLANAATYFIDGGELYGPGTVLVDAVATSGAMWTGLPHLYVYRTSIWNHRFDGVRLPEYNVRFLPVVPISEEEAKVREEVGPIAFDALLDAKGLEVFDPLRNSA